PALTNLLDELNIKYKKSLGGAKKYLKINQVTIYLYSLEKHDNIRGIEVGLVAGDEIAYSNIEAFNVIMGRLRCKKGSLKARFTSSPNGFNWVYDLINTKKASMVRGKTSDNIFLPKAYYDQLVELYGGLNTPLAKQELGGEFINLTSGSVYHAFDRTKHVKKLQINPLLPVYVGLDFNIENMRFTYIQDDKGTLKILKEVILKESNSNTFDAAIHILSDLQGFNIKIIPDSTGKSRKTSAESGKTDHQILKDYGLNVLETQNPRIKDRQNTVNSLLIKSKLEIDESCVDTIKEFETLKHSDEEGKVSHLAVGVGYVAWKLYPLKPIQKPSQSIDNPFLKMR
ncbi:MAG: terminase family protein, partial [Bdellovibrionales bacterium]|nr:terminase family protein [Bdellovibrionales bacterium]